MDYPLINFCIWILNLVSRETTCFPQWHKYLFEGKKQILCWIHVWQSLEVSVMNCSETQSWGSKHRSLSKGNPNSRNNDRVQGTGKRRNPGQQAEDQNHDTKAMQYRHIQDFASNDWINQTCIGRVDQANVPQLAIRADESRQRFLGNVLDLFI